MNKKPEQQKKDQQVKEETCPHYNTIDAGDDDHQYIVCVDCGKQEGR